MQNALFYFPTIKIHFPPADLHFLRSFILCSTSAKPFLTQNQKLTKGKPAVDKTFSKKRTALCNEGKNRLHSAVLQFFQARNSPVDRLFIDFFQEFICP